MARTSDGSGGEHPAEAGPALELAWREHWGRLVGLLIGQTARPDVAEDAVADAFAAAARTWPTSGVPASPGAWLLTAARRRALDVLRSEAIRRRKQPLMVVDTELRERAAATTDPGSPVVRLARAVAVAEAWGPAAGLVLLDGLDDALPHHHRPPAVRGELLLRLGRAEEAAHEFERALMLVRSDTERRHLEDRAAAAARAV